LLNGYDPSMNSSSPWGRAAALAGAAVATLSQLALIANYAYPPAAAMLLAVAPHAR
jgi:hypothetical protein